MKIQPKNWKKFQHYNKRNPPWIKLHKGLLDDYDFQCLQDASKALAISLWLLASEYQAGEIDLSLRQICYRLRIAEDRFILSLNELEKQGFMDVYHDDASAMLARCYQYATPETETETETETEKRQGAKIKKSPPRSASLIELPDFILPEAWFGFLEMRKKIKKPPTERACQLLIKKLVMFHNAGHDTNAILDQSTTNGWQDLFEIKESYRGNRSGLKTFEQQRVENIKNAMMGAMNDEAGLAGIQFLDG